MTRRLTFSAVTTALVAASMGTALTARADVPEEERVYITQIDSLTTPLQNSVDSIGFQLAQDGHDVTGGITVHVSTSSCGRFLQDASYTFNGDREGLAVYLTPSGEYGFGINSVNKNVAKSIEYQLDIVHPGEDAYRISGSFDAYSVKRPSCAQLESEGVVIREWSRKVGQARVGRTVKVTRTRSNASAAYAWKVADRTVSRSRSLSLTRNMLGKPAKMVVRVEKGDSSKKKVLNFGPVRN